VLRVTELLNQVLPPGLVSTVSGTTRHDTRIEVRSAYARATCVCVTGYGKQAGTPLVRHPLIKKVTFTGSVDTGREIYKYLSRRRQLAPPQLH
jgi:delta 1-pyrroline-5-carboxylate dehydrogenase